MIWWILVIISVIYVTYDVAQRKKMSQEKKAMWIIASAIIGPVGALLYYLVEQKK